MAAAGRRQVADEHPSGRYRRKASAKLASRIF
jgi:hypothetical protein